MHSAACSAQDETQMLCRDQRTGLRALARLLNMRAGTLSRPHRTDAAVDSQLCSCDV